MSSDGGSTREKQVVSKKPGLWRLIITSGVVTEDVLNYDYPGSGTEDDPYSVDYIHDDPCNPYLLPASLKWFITIIMSFGTLSVSFASTAFSGAIPQVTEYFGVSNEIAILSVSLFVLGFAIGPMSWAPLSELYGRQKVYIAMFSLCTIFGGASIASPNIATLLVLRFLAGITGASSIVNSAGVIADIFVARERGMPITLFCSAPFLGPSLGPITSGFLGQYAGWQWVDGMTVIFTAVMLVLGVLFVPETYSHNLLQHRAKKLSTITGKVYESKLEIARGKKTARSVFSTAILRPWIMLVVEPITLIIAIYTAIVYGVLYLTFAAFPIVFEGQRGWSQGVTGLSFIGVMIGQILAMFAYFYFDGRYKKKAAMTTDLSLPETRLEPAIVGSIILPIGLFWFAWTAYPSIHWIVCMLGTTFFGFGQVLLFLSMMNYIIDSYTVFAASALAANAILRAMFGAAFPLLTTAMYDNLGVQWASSIPAFLSLACTPFPFLFYKYGRRIRSKCRYSGESQRIMGEILQPTNDEAAKNASSLAKA